MNTNTIHVHRLCVKSESQIPKAIHLKSQYSQLWSLSLIHCPLSHVSLQSLNCLASLGFLDVSFTQITFNALQSSLRPIQILELHCFHCPNLEIASQSRGFMIFSLPNVWSLNGSFANCDERHHWNEYFRNGQGRFSALYRKHFLEFDPNFVPSRLIDEENDQGSVWSLKAKELLYPLPTHFNMGFDQDIWRCTKLARLLESNVSETFSSLDAASVSVRPFVSPPSSASDSKMENSTEARSCLLLLLLGTFFSTRYYPLNLLQESLQVLFDPQDHPWAHLKVSPLHWSFQHRLQFCSLLYARLSIESPAGTLFGFPF